MVRLVKMTKREKEKSRRERKKEKRWRRSGKKTMAMEKKTMFFSRSLLLFSTREKNTGADEPLASGQLRAARLAAPGPPGVQGGVRGPAPAPSRRGRRGRVGVVIGRRRRKEDARHGRRVRRRARGAHGDREADSDAVSATVMEKERWREMEREKRRKRDGERRRKESRSNAFVFLFYFSTSTFAFSFRRCRWGKKTSNSFLSTRFRPSSLRFQKKKNSKKKHSPTRLPGGPIPSVSHDLGWQALTGALDEFDVGSYLGAGAGVPGQESEELPRDLHSQAERMFKLGTKPVRRAT